MVKWKFTTLLFLSVLLLSLLVLGCNATNTNQAAATKKDNVADVPKSEDFYKGKKVEFIVPYSPGGGYDAHVRMIAPFLEKHLGVSVAVNNVTGAGGVIGANTLYQAEPDGLTIGLLNAFGLVYQQIGEAPGFKGDLAKYKWLGRLGDPAHVWLVAGNGPFKTADDLFNTSKPIKFGAPGVGSAENIMAIFAGKELGFPVTTTVGFDGSAETVLAVIKGELDAESHSADSAVSQVESGDLRALFQLARKRHFLLPDVPVLAELERAKGKDLPLLDAWIDTVEMNRLIAAPPDVPAERVKALREAVEKAQADPDYVKISQETKRPVSPLKGEEIEEIVNNVLNSPKEFKEAIKENI